MASAFPDLEKNFRPQYVERGQAYYRTGAVVECVEDDDGMTVRGRVRGSQPSPYNIAVVFKPGGYIDASCSCPVGFNCKHGVALVIRYTTDGVTRVGRTPSSTTPAARKLASACDAPLSRELVGSIEGLARICADTTRGAPAGPRMRTGSNQKIIYILKLDWRQELTCEPYVVSLLKNGSPGIATLASAHKIAAYKVRAATAEDQSLCRLWMAQGYEYQLTSALPDDPDLRELTIRRMVSTGRCLWMDKGNRPLSLGEPRTGQLQWVTNQRGDFILRIGAAPTRAAESGIECGGGFYVDTAAMVIGPLHDRCPLELKRRLVSIPAVKPEEVKAVARLLQEHNLAEHLPLPARPPTMDVQVVKAVPSLWLESRRQVSDEPLPLAVFSLGYGDCPDMDRAETTIDESTGEERVTIRRKDEEYERQCSDELNTLGFREVPASRLDVAGRGTACLEMHNVADWASFVAHGAQLLSEQGWQIGFDPSFTHRLVEPADDWDINIEEDAGWWFNLELGIDVDGERVSLLPLIASALNGVDARDPLASLSRLSIDGKFIAPMPDGRLVALPLDRVQPLVETLLEMFDKDALAQRKEGVPICAPLLVALMDKIARGRRGWSKSAQLKRLFRNLRRIADGKVEPAPRGFKASLREYQARGVAWLQFVRDTQLGGILADDMGLGKTVQALAHLQIEKNAGRLTSPCLIVCPTSVIPNWAAEAERFCPELAVIVHRGKNRAGNWIQMLNTDLVVTSYAVLLRDTRRFIKESWHCVILDEAQAIKNPETNIARTVRSLTANHRLCLTGTPIENHLGDLWSQFDFLVPGLLGNSQTFKSVFRVPIEQFDNEPRARALSARVSPFILRRAKEEVASELPPKTTIIKTVELEGGQRDLYETVRLAMQRKVRLEIEAKGLARSQIVILEALLKLRQACCDPALVKLEAAKGVTGSAKREALAEMLAELIEGRRRVLVFSQFTTMLDLVKRDLGKMGIDYVELTGATNDRQTPVRRFQEGEVPLFLLSLKAGGTGINLTAADTVIHYDPWWNPHVEDQATDRAHRIGQDKPVFAYKLIARGTIEERMLELQEHKRHIAGTVLSNARARGLQLSRTELDMLFEPIDGLGEMD